jgi:transcriptional regulator with XRE-family HTH domain
MKPLSFKERAVKYRRKGYSYNLIAGRLKLAKSTLSNWLKEIPYHPNEKVLKRIQLAPMKAAEKISRIKIAEIKRIKILAEKEIGVLTKRDLWLLGIGLYLGEGSKLYETIRIINSDPEIIKIALKWFKDICGLKNKNFVPSVHLYPDSNIEKSIDYWSKITGVSKKQFGKTQIDKRTNKSGKKKRSLPHGTLHLQIKSWRDKKLGKNLHRRIMGWIEAIIKKI